MRAGSPAFNPPSGRLKQLRRRLADVTAARNQNTRHNCDAILLLIRSRDDSDFIKRIVLRSTHLFEPDQFQQS